MAQPLGVDVLKADIKAASPAPQVAAHQPPQPMQADDLLSKVDASIPEQLPENKPFSGVQSDTQAGIPDMASVVQQQAGLPAAADKVLTLPSATSLAADKQSLAQSSVQPGLETASAVNAFDSLPESVRAQYCPADTTAGTQGLPATQSSGLPLQQVQTSSGRAGNTVLPEDGVQAVKQTPAQTGTPGAEAIDVVMQPAEQQQPEEQQPQQNAAEASLQKPQASNDQQPSKPSDTNGVVAIREDPDVQVIGDDKADHDAAMGEAEKRTAADIFEQAVIDCKAVITEANSVLLEQPMSEPSSNVTSQIAAKERAVTWRKELQGLLNRCKVPQLYIGVLGDTGALQKRTQLPCMSAFAMCFHVKRCQQGMLHHSLSHVVCLQWQYAFISNAHLGAQHLTPSCVGCLDWQCALIRMLPAKCGAKLHRWNIA